MMRYCAYSDTDVHCTAMSCSACAIKLAHDVEDAADTIVEVVCERCGCIIPWEQIPSASDADGNWHMVQMLMLGMYHDPREEFVCSSCSDSEYYYSLECE